MMMHEQMT